MLALPEVGESSFVMEGATIERHLAELDSSSVTLEGGLGPIATPGISQNFRMVPLAAKPLCGDGVQQSGEDCDGSDLGGATCASRGLGGGALSCSASCTFVTAVCAGNQGPGGGGGDGGSGGGGGRPWWLPPIAITSPPVQPQPPPQLPPLTAPLPAQPIQPAAPQISVPVRTPPPQKTPALKPGPKKKVILKRSIIIRPPKPARATRPAISLDANQVVPIKKKLPLGLGSATAAEVGIAVRLASIYRFESIFASIPAFEGGAAAFSPSLLALRPGAASLEFLLFPIPLLRKRRRTWRRARGEDRNFT